MNVFIWTIASKDSEYHWPLLVSTFFSIEWSTNFWPYFVSVRTLNQIFPTSETKSFTKSSPRLLHYPAKTYQMFKSGVHPFHPSPAISASTSSPSVISPSPFLVLRKEAKRTARRKKLFLSTDRNKVPTSDVFSALEKIWRRHFGVFSNF